MAVTSSGAIAPRSGALGEVNTSFEPREVLPCVGSSTARVGVRKARLSQAALANLEKGKGAAFMQQRAAILPEIDTDEDGILMPAEVANYRRVNHFETDDDFARFLKDSGFVSARWCTTLIRMSYAVPKSSDLNRGVAVISFERGTDTENRKARLADLEDHLATIATPPQPKSDEALEDEMGK